MTGTVLHRAWRLGADIDTDVLAPGHAMKHGIDTIAQCCLESVRPEFAREVRRGDVIVAGPNFGIGSSREQAAAVLVHLGVAAVIAPSYSGLYFRNAFNVGLLLLTCAEAESLPDGAMVSLDVAAPALRTVDGAALACEPVPPFLMDMVRAGGLLKQLKLRLARRRMPVEATEHLAVLHATVSLHAAQPASPALSLQARRWLIDTLGCAIAGRHAAEVQRLEAAMAALEPGAFHFPGGPPLGVHGAAQVIAMAATWDEACEGHALAHGRPGVPLAAALLPPALHRGATLAAWVDAFVLGYEVGARAGAWLRIRPGMHVDANWPALGVAAGVARLLGLGAAEIVQAVDIAACQLATSLYLPVASGRTSRNTYLAHSALLGLQAAFASASGVDAPPDALVHYAGTHAVATTRALPEATTPMLLDAYLKPFAAVRHVHYGAVAAQRIRGRIGGDTSAIHGIALSVYQEAVVYCGNRAPRTPIQAQFSLSFGVAAMLRFGELDPSVYTPARFDDAELRRLEALVVLKVDADMTARGERGATLAVERDGAWTEEAVDTIAGDAAHPLDRATLVAKFCHYAARSVPADRAAAFCDTVLDADDIELGRLWQLLTATTPASYETTSARP